MDIWPKFGTFFYHNTVYVQWMHFIHKHSLKVGDIFSLKAMSFISKIFIKLIPNNYFVFIYYIHSNSIKKLIKKNRWASVVAIFIKVDAKKGPWSTGLFCWIFPRECRFFARISSYDRPELNWPFRKYLNICKIFPIECRFNQDLKFPFKKYPFLNELSRIIQEGGIIVRKARFFHVISLILGFYDLIFSYLKKLQNSGHICYYYK